MAGRSSEGGLSTLTGRVVDVSGAPVPDARVAIVGGSVPVPEIALLCDSQGRFSLRLPPGVFTLRAHGPAATGEVDVRSPPSNGEVLIVIDR